MKIFPKKKVIQTQPNEKASYPLGTEIIENNSSSVEAIFMHIHKCAGTSFINALIDKPEIICCVARPGNFPGRTGIELIPDKIWQNSFKFTFVRNPFARIVSAYLMFQKSARWNPIFPEFADFVDFLRWSDVHRQIVDEQIPTSQYILKVENLIHHCSSYQNKKYKIQEMDFVGRVETLSQDLEYIRKKLNLETLEIPHKNKSEKNYHYTDFYTKKTKSIIGEIYADDLEMFDYTFE